MHRGLVTALRTLTALRVPGKDADDLAAALPWFPIAGALLGTILLGLAQFLGLIGTASWPEGVAISLLLGGVLLTRAIHLDGLADCADGFGGGVDRESVLRIMKDSHTGAFGVTAVALALMVKWVALARLVESDATLWIVTAYVVSRTALVDLAFAQPYARDQGGTARRFVERASWRHVIAAFAVAALLVVLAHSWRGAGALALGWLTARQVGIAARRRIGGITGDVMGACNEIVETMLLMLGALCF